MSPGARVAGADVGHKVTLQTIADRVGVSRKTINTVENGVFVPSTMLALKLAVALGRSVEELFRVDEG